MILFQITEFVFFVFYSISYNVKANYLRNVDLVCINLEFEHEY